MRNAESGSELGKFKRDSEIWAVDWLPVEGSKKTHIVVYDWAPSVTIYDHAGTVISPSRQIDFDPCCSSPLSKMPYQCVGGSEGSLALLSRDGIKLSKLDAHDSPFVWATQVRQIAGKQEILSSDHRGRVKCRTINFNRVHGLHKSLYATRDNLTDVLVEQLDDPQVGKLRVKCREIISLVAVYETVLAVQCRSRMKIFSQSSTGYEAVSVFDVPESVSLLVRFIYFIHSQHILFKEGILRRFQKFLGTLYQIHNRLRLRSFFNLIDLVDLFANSKWCIQSGGEYL